MDMDTDRAALANSSTRTKSTSAGVRVLRQAQLHWQDFTPLADGLHDCSSCSSKTQEPITIDERTPPATGLVLSPEPSTKACSPGLHVRTMKPRSRYAFAGGGGGRLLQYHWTVTSEAILQLFCKWQIVQNPADQRYPDSYYLGKAHQAHVSFANPFHPKWDQTLELLAPPETMLGQILQELDRRLQRAVIIIPIWWKAICWPHIVRHGLDLTILDDG
ncbi:hypothetical protein SARC_15278, partial [Sphaeroforma arctica JP610]